MAPRTNFDQFFDGDCSSSSFDIKTAPLTPSKKSVRSVGFAPSSDQVYEIPHSSKDLSEEEIKSIWMSRQELKTSRRNCFIIVQKMSFSISLGEDSPRGLENYIKHNKEKIRQIRIAAKESVLGLQEFQHLKGVRVAALVAELYANDAYHSRLDAHARGLEDANDALEAHIGQ
jgi:hypothetical protein